MVRIYKGSLTLAGMLNEPYQNEWEYDHLKVVFPASVEIVTPQTMVRVIMGEPSMRDYWLCNLADWGGKLAELPDNEQKIAWLTEQLSIVNVSRLCRYENISTQKVLDKIEWLAFNDIYIWVKPSTPHFCRVLNYQPEKGYISLGSATEIAEVKKKPHAICFSYYARKLIADKLATVS